MGLFRFTVETKTTKCPSLKICSIPGLKMKRGNTSWRGLCNIPTHTSWMSSAPDATRSQLFSVMHKLLSCALVAPQSFVSPLVAGQGSQKDVPLERSNTKEYLRPPTNSRVGTVTRSIPKMPQRNCSALDSYWRKIFFIHYLQ